MYPTTGYTPPVTDLQIVNNITDRLISVVGRDATLKTIFDLAAKHGEVNGDFIREYDHITRSAEGMKVKAQAVLAEQAETADPRTPAQKDADLFDAEVKQTYAMI